MTPAGDQHQPQAGILAVLWALACFLVETLSRGFISRDLQHQVASLEADHAIELFGGRQRRNPDFQALSPDQQRAALRRILADYFRLRRTRELLHLIATKLGVGYRRGSAETCARRFERRIASRRGLSLGSLRLPHVAAASKPLAGAPP